VLSRSAAVFSNSVAGRTGAAGSGGGPQKVGAMRALSLNSTYHETLKLSHVGIPRGTVQSWTTPWASVSGPKCAAVQSEPFIGQVFIHQTRPGIPCRRQARVSSTAMPASNRGFYEGFIFFMARTIYSRVVYFVGDAGQPYALRTMVSRFGA